MLQKRVPTFATTGQNQFALFSTTNSGGAKNDGVQNSISANDPDLYLAKQAVKEAGRKHHRFTNVKSSRQEQKQTSQGSESQSRWIPPKPSQTPAGNLYDEVEDDDGRADFIPQIPFSEDDGVNRRKRVLVLCTGGTLTMAPDPSRGGSLAPVQGALTEYLLSMQELQDPNMPEVVAHEYTPLLDSSDLGPSDWALLATDIRTNYYHFDGFVVLMGTDTMAYTATALSFMLENLGKPVVFTGSQIPFSEPYNDARRNLIMALIFACRDTLNEVSIFFHDRLLRACRSTKVNTTKLLAFDSPNQEPLAKIGINIDENEHLFRPHPRGALRTHSRMDTRLLTLRLVPGFDDAMMKHIIQAATATNLKGLVLQLYGAGNIPSIKDDFVQVLADAKDAGVLVVASTQCFTGAVMMGHYATGRALMDAGVVSANDMTLEAISCKLAYLFGRGDLTFEEIGSLLDVSLRGEVTPACALPPPPFATSYQRACRKGKNFL
jgi:L-asparaginase